MRYLLLVLLLLGSSAPAFALYKCNSGGKTTYTDSSCANGTSSDLGDISDKATPSNLAQAHEQNAQDKRKLKELETARHRREAAEERQQRKLAKAADNKRKKCASLQLKKKWSNEDAANATSKNRQKAIRRARRLAEKYELECGKR
jgi:hypothetical protein